MENIYLKGNKLGGIYAELKLNSSIASKTAILIIRLERIKLLRYIVLPFRVIVLNFMFNTEVPRVVPIGVGLRLPHPYNIIVSPRSRIGRFCTIYQGVTLGADDLSENYGAPQISSCCFIATGASILGNIKVGSNSVVAAGSVLSIDLDKNSFYKNYRRYDNRVSIINFVRSLFLEKVLNNHT